jgi:hypothetical protein
MMKRRQKFKRGNWLKMDDGAEFFMPRIGAHHRRWWRGIISKVKGKRRTSDFLGEDER